MKGVREIKNRIRAVQNTAKITRAMQLVASSKMKHAQQLAINSRPYLLMLSEIVASISFIKDIKIKHPFFELRESNNLCVLLIGTEKGLCGALNQNLFKYVAANCKNAKYITIGKRATQFVLRNGYELMAEFSISDKITFHDVRVIVEFVKNAYLEGKIDKLEVAYPRFINAMCQESVVQRVLPMSNFDDELKKIYQIMNINQCSVVNDEREMLIEPGMDEIVERLSPVFLAQNIYKLVLEAKAAEHSARVLAMKTATDNADSLSKSLNIEYNRVRQAAITNEIIEISSASQGK